MALSLSLTTPLDTSHLSSTFLDYLPRGLGLCWEHAAYRFMEYQTDNIDFLWELARLSTLRISSIGLKLAAERTRPSKRERVLGKLGVSLYLVHRVLELPGPDQQNHLLRRLEELLLELERLCTVSFKPLQIDPSHLLHI